MKRSWFWTLYLLAGYGIFLGCLASVKDPAVVGLALSAYSLALGREAQKGGK